MPNQRNSTEPLDKARSIVAAMKFWNRFKHPFKTSAFAFPEVIERTAESLGILHRLPRVTVDPSTIYTVRISLDDSKPRIWRRVSVPGCSLEVLHHVVQIVMGWTDLHLHEFVVRKVKVPAVEDQMMIDERSITIPMLHAANIKKFYYTYDYSDQWRHTILIENVVTDVHAPQYPKCLGGKCPAPHEDAGGVHSWSEIINALQNRNLPEDEGIRAVMERLDLELCLTDFDLSETNLELRRAFNRRGELRGA